MEQSGALKKDIDSIQLAVRKLSDSVNKCGIDWSRRKAVLTHIAM